MPKKTVDIWADLKSGGTSTNPSEDFPVVKKKGSKSTSEVAAKATKQSKEKAEKNPLTHAEGTPANDINISTAVSAALSKALDEDMEVEKLGMILDTVIDQVDDADLASESFEKKSFGMVALFLVIVSIISAIILIPLVIVMGYGILTIDSSTSALELIGYQTDENVAVSDATHFSIKSEETGKYVSMPMSEGEVVSLSSTEDQGFYFHVTADGALQIAYDDSLMKVSSDILTISNVDGSIVWANSADVSDIGVSLVRESEDSNNFALTVDNSTQFIGTKKVAEGEYELALENKAEYFSLEADVEMITTLGQYKEDYNTLYGDTALTFGIRGNALSLYSNETHKYVNSYEQIDYSEMPFIKIGSNEYADSLTTSNRIEYNFFINPVGTAIEGAPDSSKLSMGAYQTTPIEWSKIDSSLTSTSKTKFPLLTYSGDKVVLQQYTDAYDINNGDTPTAYAETEIGFMPNPHDLHQKAIYFVNADKYMTTEGGYVGLEEISSNEEPEYFTIKHGESRNPELFSMEVPVDDITETTATVKATSNDFSNISSVEMYLFGYQDEESLNAHISDVFNDSDDIKQDLKRVLKNDMTHFKHEEFANKSNTLEYKVKNLEFSTRYVGTISFYRNGKDGTPPYITTLPITFQTVDESGNANSGAIEIPLPEIGDPTITSDTPAVVGTVYNSSDLENENSVNINDDNQSQYDITEANMVKDASSSIDVTVNLENGEIDNGESGVVTGLRVTLTDTAGTQVAVSEITSEDLVEGLDDGNYTFLFSNLESSTDYNVAVSICDIEGNWYSDTTTYGAAVPVTTGRPIPQYTGPDPKVDKTSTRTTITGLEVDGFKNFDQTVAGTGDYIYLEFKSTDLSTPITTIAWTVSDFIDAYADGETLTTQTGEIRVYLEEDVNGNPRISIDGLDSRYEYSVTLYAWMGDLSDTAYNDWSSDSPLWAEPTNKQGKSKWVEIIPSFDI